MKAKTWQETSKLYRNSRFPVEGLLSWKYTAMRLTIARKTDVDSAPKSQRWVTRGEVARITCSKYWLQLEFHLDLIALPKAVMFESKKTSFWKRGFALGRVNICSITREASLETSKCRGISCLPEIEVTVISTAGGPIYNNSERMDPLGFSSFPKDCSVRSSHRLLDAHVM